MSKAFRGCTPLSFRPRPRLWHFAHVKPSPVVSPRWSPLSLRLSLPLSFRGSEASREICSSQPGPRAIHLARAVVDYQWVSEYFVWGGGKIDTTLHRVKSVLIHIQSVRKSLSARWFAGRERPRRWIARRRNCEQRLDFSTQPSSVTHLQLCSYFGL